MLEGYVAKQIRLVNPHSNLQNLVCGFHSSFSGRDTHTQISLNYYRYSNNVWLLFSVINVLTDSKQTTKYFSRQSFSNVSATWFLYSTCQCHVSWPSKLRKKWMKDSIEHIMKHFIQSHFVLLLLNEKEKKYTGRPSDVGTVSRSDLKRSTQPRFYASSQSYEFCQSYVSVCAICFVTLWISRWLTIPLHSMKRVSVTTEKERHALPNPRRFALSGLREDRAPRTDPHSEMTGITSATLVTAGTPK